MSRKKQNYTPSEQTVSIKTETSADGNNPFHALTSKFKCKDHAFTNNTKIPADIPERSARVQQKKNISPQEDENIFLDAMQHVLSYKTGKRQRNATAHADDEPENFACLLAAASVAKPAPHAQPPAEHPDLSNVPVSPCSRPVPARVHDHEQPSGPADPLFSQAMADVAPIRGKGRDIPPAPVRTPVKAPPHEYTLDDIVSGKIEFSLEYTEEFIEGHIMGLDPLLLSKMRNGQYSPEAHIDLHGQNIEQAYASLSLFIKAAYQNNHRHLLVVTGRGRNSPDGTGVLRERLQAWLTRDPFKRVTLAFCTALPRDGGAGALYVLLRKRKKNQGRILWDKTPTEEDLLL